MESEELLPKTETRISRVLLALQLAKRSRESSRAHHSPLLQTALPTATAIARTTTSPNQKSARRNLLLQRKKLPIALCLSQKPPVLLRQLPQQRVWFNSHSRLRVISAALISDLITHRCNLRKSRLRRLLTLLRLIRRRRVLGVRSRSCGLRLGK